MSGGHFNYIQYRFGEVVDQMEEILKKGKDYYDLDDEAIEYITVGMNLVKIAQIFVQRTDWLISGDDGLESFKERLRKDLLALPFDFRMVKEDFKE